MLWKNNPFNCCSSVWEIVDWAPSPQSGALTWAETDGGLSSAGHESGKYRADAAGPAVLLRGW